MTFLPTENTWKYYVSNNTTLDDFVRKPNCYPCFAYLKSAGMNGNKEVAYLYSNDLEKMTELMKALSDLNHQGVTN